ncbi:hypothetical protein MXB_2619 [Myxobolus squamalis]|nr:hypothetical protein MXB_2619 [Myxobolus squamalis]
MKIACILARDTKGGIGKNGFLPWKIKEDMKYFCRITSNVSKEDKGLINGVIMGRKTWESIPEKFRPLSNRINVICSSIMKSGADYSVFTSLSEAINNLESNPIIENIFIIGGSMLYRVILIKMINKEAFNHPKCEHLYITEIEQDFKCDTFATNIGIRFELV